MAVLHILRSKPDPSTETLMNTIPVDESAKVIKLYADDIDWEAVVEDIFNHEQIICWW